MTKDIEPFDVNDPRWDYADCPSPERLANIKNIGGEPPEWFKEIARQRRHWRRNLEIWNAAKSPTGMIH